MAKYKQHGYTYLFVVFWVALVSASAATTAELWSTALRRDNEAELLYVGGLYQAALVQFGVSGRYPKSLEELIGNQAQSPPKRFLRKRYADPITKSLDWGLVTLPDGEIIGVYSKSDARPLKTQGFPAAQENFTNKDRYSDWVFLAKSGATSPQAPGNPVKPK